MPKVAGPKSGSGKGSIRVGPGRFRKAGENVRVHVGKTKKEIQISLLENKKYTSGKEKLREFRTKIGETIKNGKQDLGNKYLDTIKEFSKLQKLIESEGNPKTRGEISKIFLDSSEKILRLSKNETIEVNKVNTIRKELEASIKSIENTRAAERVEADKTATTKPEQQKPEQQQVVSRFQKVGQRVGKQEVRRSKLEAKLGKTVLNKISNEAKNSLYNSGVYTKDNFKLHLEEKTKSLNSVTAANIKSIIKSYKDIKTTEGKKKSLIDEIKELGKLEPNEIKSIEGMGKGSLEYLKRQINSGEFKKENLQKIINTNTAKREALRGKTRREKNQYYKQQKQQKLLADIDDAKVKSTDPDETKVLEDLKESFAKPDSKLVTEADLQQKTAERKEAEAAQQKEIFDMGRNRELAARIVKILKNARERDIYTRNRMIELLKQITEANKQNKEVVFNQNGKAYAALIKTDPSIESLSQKSAAETRQRRAEAQVAQTAKQMAETIKGRIAALKFAGLQQGGYTKKKHRKLHKKKSKILKTRKVKKTRKHLNNIKQ